MDPSGHTAGIVRLPCRSRSRPASRPAKAERGVRSIVVGDFTRRLVACTLAQQFGAAALPVCSVHSGGEALAHSLQASTDSDHNMTLPSVDGVGAFDLISRNAMLSALRGLRPTPFCPSSACSMVVPPVFSGLMPVARCTASTKLKGGNKATP